jgi:YesN/AraC family two-component response regulator
MSAEEDMTYLKTLKILYVEDEVFTRQMFSQFIGYHAGSPTVAKNGEDGLKLYYLIKPDIIITDVTMPKMGGLEMIRRIRSTDEFVKVIVMSAFSDRELLLDAVDIHIDAYLVKPVMANDITKALLKCARLLRICSRSKVETCKCET